MKNNLSKLCVVGALLLGSTVLAAGGPVRQIHEAQHDLRAARIDNRAAREAGRTAHLERHEARVDGREAHQDMRQAQRDLRAGNVVGARHEMHEARVDARSAQRERQDSHLQSADARALRSDARQETRAAQRHLNRAASEVH